MTLPTDTELSTYSALDRYPELERALPSRTFLLPLVLDFAHGIAVKDATGRLAFVNRVLCAICGRRPDELLGSPWADLAVERDRSSLQAQQERRRNLLSCAYPLTLARPDGRHVDVLVTPHALGRDGVLLGTVIVVSELATYLPPPEHGMSWRSTAAPRVDPPAPASPPPASTPSRGHPAPLRLPESLSAREREVLTLFARGFQPATIGERLSISGHTARNHLKNVCAKLGVASLSQLREHLALLTP